MDDRCIMENLLVTEKGICDLYLHGTIEAGTKNVNQAFGTALQDSLCMQSDIYKEMSSRGWYKSEQAPEQQIQQLKQQYAAGGSQ